MNFQVELSSIILIYEESLLGEKHISDKTIIWVLWSDRPLTSGLAEKLNLFVSIKMLSISVCELSKFLVGNLIVLNRLKEPKSECRRSTLDMVSRKLIQY